MQLRVVGRQRDVITQLAQEFALAAAERLGGAPRHDQHGEHIATLHHERNHHHGAQPATHQALRKGKIHRGDVGLVDLLAGHAARQPVLVDFDSRSFVHVELECQLFAASADARDGERPGLLLVITQHCEVHRQVLLDAAHHHLKDAREIVPFGNRVRDPPQQVEPFELHQRAHLRIVAHPDLTSQVGVQRLELEGAGAHAAFERFIAHLELLLDAHARALSAVPICMRLSSRLMPNAQTPKCAVIANLLADWSEKSMKACARATPRP